MGKYMFGAHTEAEGARAWARLSEYKEFGIDIETVNLDDRTPIGVGIHLPNGDSFWFTPPDIPLAELRNPRQRKIFWDGRFDAPMLGIPYSQCDDAAIASRVYGWPGKLQHAYLEHFGVNTITAKEMMDSTTVTYIKELKKGPAERQRKADTMLECDAEAVGKMCMHHARNTLHMWQFTTQQPGFPWKAYNVDLRMLPILDRIEERGIDIDKDGVLRTAAALRHKVQLYHTLAQQIAGDLSFNVGSNDQLALMLYKRGHHMKLKYSKKQKERVPDMSAATIKEHYYHDPLARVRLRYSHYKKLLGTYVAPLIGKDRYHAAYTIDVTETGRLSSKKMHIGEQILLPVDYEIGTGNAQNWPKSMRTLLIAAPGRELLAQDFCLEENTLIQVPGGTRCIKDVQPGDVVVSWHRTHRLARVKRVADTGMQPCYLVMLDNGKTIIASELHRFQRLHKGAGDPDAGLVCTKDLHIGDRLHPSNKAVHNGHEHYGRRNLTAMLKDFYGCELVHHKDGNSMNNEPSNWELGWTEAQHNSHHAKLQNGTQWRGNVGVHRSYEGANNPNYGKHKNSHVRICTRCGKEHRRPNSWGVKKYGLCEQSCQGNHKVVSVQYVGLRHCYDLEVEGTKRFCLDAGVVVHNSQIELRVLAHISGDKLMREVYGCGGDLHQVAMDQTGITDRTIVKSINFGVAYGCTAHSIIKSAAENNIALNEEEAQGFLDAWLGRFTGVRAYIMDTREFARRHGYVHTMYGRRRTIDYSGFGRDSDPENQAINMPIQGTAADIFKELAIDYDAQGVPMVGFIHDEIVVDNIPGMRYAPSKKLAVFDTPLTTKIGPNYGALKEVA